MGRLLINYSSSVFSIKSYEVPKIKENAS